METPGYKINGKVYPLVSVEDWTNQDFVLARQLTRQSFEDLFSPDGDRVLLIQALVGVAVNHGEPTLGMDRVIDFIYGLKPNEAEEVGFPPVEEDAVIPPADAAVAAAHGNGSSSISAERMELTLES